MVAAAATTAFGDAAIYAFDARTGAPLYDPYPLPTPVYPDRGGLTIANGRLFAATIEGSCLCLDALRGTRLWQTNLGGRVFGAVTIAADDADSAAPLLVAIALKNGTGALMVIDAETGTIQQNTPLPGTPDTAPAFAKGRAFVHTDDGSLTAIDTLTGATVWSARGSAGFDAAPIVFGGAVYSCDAAGTARRYDAATGDETWQLAVTSSPFAGTPACDGELLYLPADDGVHLVAAERGQSVRRYPLRQPVRSSPVVVGGTLFFGATDGVLYGALPGHGLERLYETTSAGAQIVAAPAYADRTLFVVATNGVLYALAVGMEDDSRGL
jgi:outer membrane protein assembly factor BamB